MLGIILVINTIALLYLAVIWSKSCQLNVAIKVTLFVLSFFNTLLALQHYGYVVKNDKQEVEVVKQVETEEVQNEVAD